jgi:hypothetical protein
MAKFWCGVCQELIPPGKIAEHALKHVQKGEIPDGREELKLLESMSLPNSKN